MLSRDIFQVNNLDSKLWVKHCQRHNGDGDGDGDVDVDGDVNSDVDCNVNGDVDGDVDGDIRKDCHNIRLTPPSGLLMVHHRIMLRLLWNCTLARQ